MNKNIQFLRNAALLGSKNEAIEKLKSETVINNVLDGTLVEARYTESEEVKTIFALYHITEEKKTATIFDSEGYLEDYKKLSDRLDKIDGGEGGDGETSLIDRVKANEGHIGTVSELKTDEKTNLVGAINETFGKIGTVPVLADAQIRFKDGYTLGEEGKISEPTKEEGEEVLVMSFKTIGSDGEASYKATEIDFEKVVLESELGNGLTLSDGHKISVKLDSANENDYLTVGEGGLKLSGISDIKTKVDGLTTGENSVQKQIEKAKTEITSAADEKYATKTELTNGLKDKVTETKLTEELNKKISKADVSDGLAFDNKLKVKLDSENEGEYLTVTSNGLKLKGIKEIETVTAASLNDLNTRIKNFEEGPNSVKTQISQIKKEVEKNGVSGTDKEIKVEYSEEGKTNKIGLAEDLVIDCGTY